MPGFCRVFMMRLTWRLLLRCQLWLGELSVVVPICHTSYAMQCHVWTCASSCDHVWKSMEHEIITQYHSISLDGNLSWDCHHCHLIPINFDDSNTDSPYSMSTYWPYSHGFHHWFILMTLDYTRLPNPAFLAISWISSRMRGTLWTCVKQMSWDVADVMDVMGMP